MTAEWAMFWITFIVYLRSRPTPDAASSRCCSTSSSGAGHEPKHMLLDSRYGDETWRITLKMENVDLSLREGHEEIDLLHVCNYDEISLKNVTVKNASGGSLIKKWSEGRILLENVVAEGCKEKVKTAEEPFFAMTI